MQINYNRHSNPNQYEPDIVASDIMSRIVQGELEVKGVREGVAQVDLLGSVSVLSRDQMAHLFGAGEYSVPVLLPQVGYGEYERSRAIVVRKNGDHEPDVFITDLPRAFDSRMRSGMPFGPSSSRQLIRGQLETTPSVAGGPGRESEARLLLTQADDRLLLQVTNTYGRRDSAAGHPTLGIITKAPKREVQPAPSPKRMRFARIFGALGLNASR